MRCPKCQVMVYDDEKVCKYCGTRVDHSAPEGSTPKTPSSTGITVRTPSLPKEKGKSKFSCCFGFFIFLSICIIIFGVNFYSIMKSDSLPDVLTEWVSNFQPPSFLASLDSEFAISREVTISEYSQNASFNNFAIKRGSTYYNSLSTFHESELKRKYNTLKTWDKTDFDIDEVTISDPFKIEDYTYYKLTYRINKGVIREEVVAAKLVEGKRIDYVYISAVNDTITDDMIKVYLPEVDTPENDIIIDIPEEDREEAVE